MKTRITTVAALLLAMFLVGEAVAQVPSSVTQQLRLSTGGAAPNYVNHRAITTAGVAPVANGWYAWDQVPVAATGVNYLLFLNDVNEVRRTQPFSTTVQNFILTVNATGTDIAYLDPANLVVAQNGLTEPTPNTVELGGTLLHNTSIDQATFNMTYSSSTGPATFTLGGGAGTLNTTIDPGAAGNLKLLNIDASLIDETILMLDASNNVVSRQLSTLIDANNGVTETVVAGVSTVQLGAPLTGGSTLLTERFVSLNAQNLNWEGAGNFNIGTGGNLSTNINTGATGNLSIQGTTLDDNTGVTTFLYTDGNNVRRATAASISTGTAATYLAVSGAGEIVRAPDPMAGIFRGRVAGDGTHDYTVPVVGLLAGAAVTCTVQNSTSSGTISVQVTTVADGTFSIECAENIQAGSSISYIAINP